VEYLLDPSKEIKLRKGIEKLEKEGRLSDDEFVKEKQNLHYKLIIRQLSKPTGYGALTFGTITTLPTQTLDFAEIVPFPHLIMILEFKRKSE